MIFIGLFILKTFISFVLSSGRKNELAPVVINCPLLLPVENNSHTLFFDMDIHVDQELRTCILQNNISKQSVLLLNTDVDISEDIATIIHTISNNPNIIIMTKYLSPKILDSPLWHFFKNNWSLLYIIITDDSKFKCKNDTMNSNDFLTLDDIMNKLWHRFQIMRVGVVFPYACKQKIAIYDGKRPSSGILYDRSIKLINATNFKAMSVAIKKSGENLSRDYPVQGSMFYRYPTAIKDCGNLHYYVNFNLSISDGFCGLDGMVMHDILAYFKFNITFNKDEKCNYYGFGVAGNLSGTLGCVIRKELDISFNSRFMTLYSEEHVDYLTYVKTDTLCALVKRPAIKPLWQGVFNLYSPPIWALIGAVLVVIGGIMWVTALINKTITGSQTKTLWWYILNSIMTTFAGFSPIRGKTLYAIRIACLLGSIFFLAIYQSHINRLYTTIERFSRIRTLKDLYNSEAKLYTSISMVNMLKQIQNPEDKIQQEFLKRTHVITGDRDRLGVVLQYKCAATLDRKSDAVMEILEQYSDSYGTPLIDIVDECFYTYYLSCITRSGFPFLEELQVFTQRLNEAGLPNIYYKWTQQMLEILTSISVTNSEPRAFSKIRLIDQSVAFGILFAGTLVSTIVFATEMWIGKRKSYELNKGRI